MTVDGLIQLLNTMPPYLQVRVRPHVVLAHPDDLVPELNAPGEPLIGIEFDQGDVYLVLGDYIPKLSAP